VVRDVTPSGWLIWVPKSFLFTFFFLFPFFIALYSPSILDEDTWLFLIELYLFYLERPMDGGKRLYHFMFLRLNTLSIFFVFFTMMKYLPSWGQHLLASFITKPRER
jgi:dolichol kinase